ncbi:type II toxin-antitoxin system RatA family toxin [Siculibacillus lacustris]|uniref:Type II toxin-antitoxin system RatA family toxin n=1 Tax=Siculibacillus lacustris TaxID=1549641 RepID=A0A4Q9VRF9_9HYPH|nr:type II toxin-antitoxin system RatA family toxin [Siculibacillus lacustris]TBW38478.1 type II toxin-antitoxin system RatA family toxin [Siculibacillus lacustris]
MPRYETSRRVRHSARQMFDLVADVESYPRFLPLCEALKVRGRQDLDEGATLLVADMTVSFKLVRETFTSRVRLDPAAMRIDVAYLDGPFRHLDNRWLFTATGEGTCDIGFLIDYEFRSRTLGALMGAVFDRAFRKFAEAFEARADAIYGRAA